MKYSNKSELIEEIKSNANLFIREYADIEETSMNIIDEEIESQKKLKEAMRGIGYGID